MSIHSTVRQTHRATAVESHIYEETDDFYDVDEYAPSSPFVERADTLQKLPLRDSTPNRQGTPQSARASPSPSKGLRDNEGLTRAIDMMQAESNKENRSTTNPESFKSSYFDPDDTCMSAFSMVPTADMTRLARLSLSPSKNSPSSSPSRAVNPSTPRLGNTGTPRTLRTPATGRDVSPTPRRSAKAGSREMTTQLLEFTEQLNYTALHSPSRRAAAFRSPPRTENANLLDFDLPPAPTPRSLPTITARELESLKAGFMSQISSLKATIDGKDATIKSLVDATDDAERRVGEISEVLREAKDARKALEDEKEDWEKRDTEIRTILREVKSELMEREKERDDLVIRVEDSDRRIEASELRARDAEARLENLRAEQQSPEESGALDDSTQKTPTRKTIDQAVENVTRELHQLYKSKHEAKVSALKRSYEKRWEKRVRELEGSVDQLKHENDELRLGRDTTITNVQPSMGARGVAVDVGTDMSPVRAATTAQDSTESGSRNADKSMEDGSASAERLEELAAQIKALEQDIQSEREKCIRLGDELSTSRAENSDLVAVVEEMLQLEPAAAAVSAAVATAAEQQPVEDAAASPRPSSHGHTRGESISDSLRPSSSDATVATIMAKTPSSKASGMAKSGFGFGAGKTSTLKRSTSGSSGSRSGILSNIEKMGRGRAME